MLHLKWTARLCLCVLWVSSGAAQTELPNAESSLFSGSGNCNFCHVARPPAVLTDSLGNDLTPSLDWRATMMANAARDPYWQAKVESEFSKNPQLRAAIEDKCSTCHMPMARTQAIFDGASGYTLAEGRNDSLAMDGVSCTVCHQIQPDNFGISESFSGGFIIDSSRVIYGPYQNPMGGLMGNFTGFEPTYGSHVITSELCATCHTLYTSYLDENGNIAGEFPEQMPYFEWKASVYAQQGTQCQHCHVERVDSPVQISWLPDSTPVREFSFKHQFVGGNTFMLTMLKENGEALGVTADAVHFDSTIARTRRQLQQRTAAVSVETEDDTNFLKLFVSVENLAGHKFPTGYPSRRAWLHIKVTNADGETFFESGAVDENGIIQNKDTTAAFELHHDIITSETQVQIYETIMGDVSGDVTLTLLHTASYLKDNRLPPKGFNTTAERYPDIAILGAAAEDDNFNHNDEGEGSGSDQVTYEINIWDQPSGKMDVLVELLYQSINPVFVEDIATHDTPAISQFLGFYESAEKLVEVIDSTTFEVDVITSVQVQTSETIPNEFSLSQNYPNPFNAGTIIPYQISDSETAFELAIYDLRGRLIKLLESGRKAPGRYQATWNGRTDPGFTASSGVYVVRLQTSKVKIARKLIMLK